MAPSSPSPRVLLVAVVVVLAAIGSGFLFVDFEAGTVEESATATTTVASTNSDSLQPVTDAYLVVDAPDTIRDDLTDELVAAYEREGITFTPTDARDSYDRAVVVVVVDEWDPRWTPVLSSGSASWRVVFDAGGHTDHVDAALADEPLLFTSSDGADLVVTAQIDLVLGARGVVSRPAYRGHLLTAVADASVSQTRAQIRRTT
ncbi:MULTISPECIES: hypothetical protein [Haloferax]|uniref:Uncharacterized protein n=1 Tax=Haloferax marinum TaxID=2666143 RepID=A0A6A8G9L7_9EURY|nr:MULTISPECIES: hypothetical protein [Haloferax]KAB1198491.1 hypothetical protein Hfx1150_13595 [Haloferax sp. CBA1150]MRW97597.1 hypothetical protein [Haloferax marinum]